MTKSKTWVSALIIVTLGLHAVPVLSYQGVGQTRWPFLAWAMYAKSYPPGPVKTTKRRLMATTAAGADAEVTPEMVGLSKSTFRNLYINPLYQGDSTTARELLARINRAREAPFVAVRTEGEIFRLADTGLVTERFPVLTFSSGSPAPSR